MKMTSSEKSTKNKKEKKFFRKKLKKSKTDEAEEKLGILSKQLEEVNTWTIIWLTMSSATELL